VLILRDVLAWRAAEVAELLDTSVASVNSALQRARTQLEQMALDEDDIIDSLDAGHRALLDQYVRAFENADIVALLGLLRAEVRLEMPPQPMWFSGRANVGRFVKQHIFSDPGVMRLLPTMANGGQPTMATYWREADGTFQPEALQVLSLRDHQIVGITAFRDTSLFGSFGLPAQLPAGTPLSTSPWSSWPAFA
jgi:RNA polymerase sigma-70 factor (ECF subfamily)